MSGENSSLWQWYQLGRDNHLNFSAVQGSKDQDMTTGPRISEAVFNVKPIWRLRLRRQKRHLLDEAWMYGGRNVVDLHQLSIGLNGIESAKNKVGCVLPVTISATAWLLSTPMIGWASIVVTWCATFLNGKDFNFSNTKNKNHKCVFLKPTHNGSLALELGPFEGHTWLVSKNF